MYGNESDLFEAFNSLNDTFKYTNPSTADQIDQLVLKILNTISL